MILLVVNEGLSSVYIQLRKVCVNQTKPNFTYSNLILLTLIKPSTKIEITSLYFATKNTDSMLSEEQVSHFSFSLYALCISLTHPSP